MSVAELVDHIRIDFHLVELELMKSLATSMDRLRGSSHPAWTSLCDAFQVVADELTAHMEKEEKVLFPWIRAGRGDLAHAPIRVMVLEHAETLGRLDALRERVRALGSASEADRLPAEVASALASLDRHVREHVHLENDVLFPRALRGES
ncbi:MAG: hemerythrin domain-containing protein [Deltaproteobacteria bacterium]|nr:hemerythrin domain-containing protein [Deltaproteobacteria bacterium]